MAKSALLVAITALSLAVVGCNAAAGDGSTESTSPTRSSDTEPTGDGLAPDGAASAEGTQTQLTRNFPGLDYLQQIPQAYRVANDHPEMLEQIPCYCPCMLYGHGALIGCYRSQHAAACATCLGEAIMAGQLLEQAGGTEANYAAVADQVKSQYRNGVAQDMAQNNSMPNLQTAGGRAFLQVCSDCHQPAHPAMYTADNWRASLSRMEQYTRQRSMEPDPEMWQKAVAYVRSTAGRYTATDGDNYRGQLASTVERLVEDEGEPAHYPSERDGLLSPEWFERMVQAHRTARDLPIELLAATEMNEPTCTAIGHNTLLECLNSGHGVTSERAIQLVEELSARANNN